jgi:hypothetical protein
VLVCNFSCMHFCFEISGQAVACTFALRFLAKHSISRLKLAVACLLTWIHAFLLSAEESLSIQLSRVHKVSHSVWTFYTSELERLEQSCASPGSEGPSAETQQQQISQGLDHPIAAAEGEVELAQDPWGIKPQAADSQRSSSISSSGCLQTSRWLPNPGR